MQYQDITAHQLVADTAVGLAQELYEELCSRHNGVYARYRDRAHFVREVAPQLRQEARQALALLLGDPKTPESEKSRIHEALVQDNLLPRDGKSVVHKSVLH